MWALAGLHSYGEEAGIVSRIDITDILLAPEIGLTRLLPLCIISSKGDSQGAAMVVQKMFTTSEENQGYLRSTRGFEVSEENMSEALIHGELRTLYVGQNILYYPVTTSTMDVARKAAQDKVAEGTIVLADEQTAGRGRFGRKWLSPPGSSILLSVVLHPKQAQLPRLNMVASLAVANSIEMVTGLKPVIKWPNDVFIEGKKVSGSLVESDAGGDSLTSAVLGIGVNINLDPASIPDIAATATSLRAVLREEVSRLEVLQSLLREFEHFYEALRKGEPIYKLWRRRLVTLGKEVRVKTGDVTDEGYAESVDSDGRLLLRRDDGTLVTITAGDVTLRS